MSKRRRKKLPQEEVIAHIDQLSHDGRGVAKIDGKATFIFGALPKETVKFRYHQQKSSYDEGIISQVITPSSQRAKVKCPHFGTCGGCQLQHLSSTAQLEHKQSAFLELLHHQAGIAANEILPPLTGELWGYRRKARISVKYVPKKGKVLVGFRERGNSFVADIESCHVLYPKIGLMLTKFSDLFMQLHAKNSIPQLEIAVGDQRTALIIRHLTPLDEHDENILVNFAEHNNFFLYLQPKGIESVQLIYPKKKNELLSYQLPDYGLTLQFHPTQFTQINHAINQKMIARAIELLSLDQNDRVLDLFCGIGNFSLPIAKYCHSVVGVEGDSMAIKQAKQNAMNNQINHCQFYCADLFQDPSHEPWFTKTYSKVLLDPPRSGAKSILAHLPKWQPKKVVYVSCNPATFARDAKILTELGYELSKAGIMDMFPHTQHVEVIGLFNYKH